MPLSGAPIGRALVASLTLIVGVCAWETSPVHAQEESVSPSDTLVSPRIFEDDRVRFSIYAPEADSVAVMGDFAGWTPRMLSRDDHGVWSVTLGPLAPNLYNYQFLVDGVPTVDPGNPHHKGGVSSVSSTFFVSGEEVRYMTRGEGPYGTVRKEWYRSASLDIVRRMHVYTPPGYEQSDAALPVLYLLHGGGDTDAQWTGIGRAHVILDRLINAGEAEPMVVVMPTGHTPEEGSPMEMGGEGDPFLQDLFGSVIPYVEEHYHVSTDRADRAIAGLSMGGVQTLNAGLFHPERFGYVLPLSTGYFSEDLESPNERFSQALEDPVVDEFELFWIAAGEDDQLIYENLQATLDLLDEHEIEYTYHETEGGHTWLVWRENLRSFAPMLFR